jgi:hypothetical protein
MLLRCESLDPPTSQMGQTLSCRPCRLNVRFARKRTRLTPLADLGRSAGQAPLHGLHAPGIAAAGDDAGRLFDVAHLLGAMGERVLEEPLRALPTLCRPCRLRCFTWLAGLSTLADIGWRSERRATNICAGPARARRSMQSHFSQG